MSARPSKFSPAVLTQIASLVKQGLTPVEIAQKVGCSVGTLRVKCSHNGISLRRRPDGRATTPSESRGRLMILLSTSAIESLGQRANKTGMSRAKFVAMLLETIARDDLYNAVLDGD